MKRRPWTIPQTELLKMVDRLGAVSVEFPSGVPGLEPCWVKEQAVTSLKAAVGGYSTAYSRLYPAVSAHWASWVLMYGPVEDLNLELDHLCRVQSCWNHSHLDLVTRSVNMQRVGTWVTVNHYRLLRRSAAVAYAHR